MRTKTAVLTAILALVLGTAAVITAAPADARVIKGADWLCHPGMKGDPCDLPNDRTDKRTGKRYPATNGRQQDKPIDCFYVYPTVTDEIGLNAPPHMVPETESIARFQAAPFNSQCRVFAPNYRQMTLYGLTPAVVASWVGNRDLPNIAYRDVLKAWRSYMKHENKGRGVVFIGHSQGTMMLRKLIREEIDPKPALRKKMVGAVLMGGNVLTKKGRTTGGDFRNIPLCTKRGQAGCVTAYSTELLGVPSLFGNSSLDLLATPMGLPTGPAYQVACTDPAKLSGDYKPVGATTPSRPYSFGIISLLMAYTTFPEALPTSSSTWTTGKGRGTSSCVDDLGFERLRLHMVAPQAVNELPLFNTHLLDMNFGLERLVSIVEQQSQTYLAAS